MKKILIWTFLIISILALVATVSLWRYDYKERSWYNETPATRKQHSPDTTAIVCILATVHQPTSAYNADSIVTILQAFQPDLILTEEDTMLLKTVHKGYNETLRKPLFARLGRSFGFGKPEEIEGRAVRKYKISHPAVDIRPFDYEGRNDFYARNNTFSKESETSNKLEDLASHHSLTTEQEKTWTDYHKINDTLNQLTNQSPFYINQQAYYDLAEKRQDYQYHKVADIVNANDSLKQYRDLSL